MNRWKLLILLGLTLLVSLALAAQTKETCQCFEEFEPSEEGNEWICRGKKNYRIFRCGEERPPICECYKKGNVLKLDIGETACGSKGDNVNCGPTDVWGPQLLILLGLTTVVTVAFAAKCKKTCQCFEEFEPSKEGNEWICRGKKNLRIFLCGEERPPICECYKKGKVIKLDIGETACGNLGDNVNCGPTDVWGPYYERNPHRAIYH
ncbi:unnamed protein product [Psylliodes chrysocephalus]|uniref:Uncharacterized protein n=1 Tax=Psylliodes chrysocephalus TaxID=3402493 RepID=A0A9P0DAU8_9CUCU|nr:unnamed protein product [Psylliodes chrysocephala]